MFNSTVFCDFLVSVDQGILKKKKKKKKKIIIIIIIIKSTEESGAKIHSVCT
jgi:hypothetical protein